MCFDQHALVMLMLQMDGILLIFLLEPMGKKKYSKAIAFRMKTDSEPKLTQETGFP